MICFKYSDKLLGLFDKICDKDDETTAHEVFAVAASYIVSSDYGLGEVLEIGAQLQANGDNTWYIDPDDDGSDVAPVYVFTDKSETKSYNHILRTWCEMTDRTLKSQVKKSSKKSKK